MNRYNLFQAIYMAFYSPSLYRDVARNWAGNIGLYLLFLLALSWLPAIYSYHALYNQFSQQEISTIMTQFPTVQIYQGQLTIDQPSPYYIKSSDQTKTYMIFDTSGNIKDLDQLKELETNILVTDSQVIMQKGGRWHSYSFKGIKDHTFTRDNLKNFSNRFYFWLFVIVYPLVVFVSYFYRLVQAALYGLINLLLVFILKVNLTYKECIRISMMAVTPAILCATVFDFFNIRFANLYYFYFLLTLGYLTFAVYANQYEDKPE